MKKLAILAAFLALPAAHAQKACSPADMQRAQKAVDMVVTWQHLSKAWKDWRHCDTGDVADTYTDAILRLMVEWKNVDTLGVDMKDPDYKSFIEAHLKSPAAKDDRSAIHSRATQSCPKGHSALCKEIEAAVSDTPPAPVRAPAAAPAPAATPAATTK